MPIAEILGAPHKYNLWPADLWPASALPPTANVATGRDRLSASSLAGAPDTAPNSTETLVFIHGWLLSQAYWQPMVAQLQDRYCCLTYDMRGFGQSVAGATQPDNGSDSRDRSAVASAVESAVASAVASAAQQPRPAIRLPDGKSWYPTAVSAEASAEVASEAPLQAGDFYSPSAC
ncbi:MAG: alpha/beta fold hydrolase, partial [Cyanobacteria bacterium J06598_3]